MRTFGGIFLTALALAAIPGLSTVAADAPADLVAREFSATFFPKPGGQVGYSPYFRYSLTVENAGGADAVDVVAQIRNTNPATEILYTGYGISTVHATSGRTLGTIAAGETRTIEWEVNAIPGAYICITVDSAKTVAESDESNNSRCAIAAYEIPA